MRDELGACHGIGRQLLLLQFFVAQIILVFFFVEQVVKLLAGRHFHFEEPTFREGVV